MDRFDPGGVLAALVFCAVGGALLAIPGFGYGPFAAIMLGLVLGAATMDLLYQSAG